MTEEQATSPAESTATPRKAPATPRRTAAAAAKTSGTTPALSPERQDAFQVARRVWPD